MNYEESYKRLTEISKEMSDSDIPLEKAVELYSEAAKLVDVCNKCIDEAKLQVEKISASEE